MEPTLWEKLKTKWRSFSTPTPINGVQWETPNLSIPSAPLSLCEHCNGLGHTTFRASLGKSGSHQHLHCGHCKGRGTKDNETN